MQHLLTVVELFNVAVLFVILVPPQVGADLCYEVAALIF